MKPYKIAVEVAKQAKDKAYEDVRYWSDQVDSNNYTRSARTKKMDKERLDHAWSRWFGACDVFYAILKHKDHYEEVYDA